MTVQFQPHDITPRPQTSRQGKSHAPCFPASRHCFCHAANRTYGCCFRCTTCPLVIPWGKLLSKTQAPRPEPTPPKAGRVPPARESGVTVRLTAHTWPRGGAPLPRLRRACSFRISDGLRAGPRPSSRDEPSPFRSKKLNSDKVGFPGQCAGGDALLVNSTSHSGRPGEGGSFHSCTSV